MYNNDNVLHIFVNIFNKYKTSKDLKIEKIELQNKSLKCID